MSHLNSVEPGPLVHLIAIDVDDLFDRSCIDAGEPSDASHQMALSCVGVGAPIGVSSAASKAETSAASEAAVAQSRKGKFALYPGVRRIFRGWALHFPFVG